ncbi:nucleotide exchange factor GrpE [bacterium]|nr:nucleotide exchange factor GrpE [bacterium]
MPKKKNEEIKKKKVETQIQQLAQTIDTLEDEKLEITNQLKRALADYQNLEKNTAKLTHLRFLQTKKGLAENIIPVVDALTIAIKTKEDLEIDEKTQAWVAGIVATIENLEKVFVDIGLKKFIPQKGKKFDPNIHEALTTVSDGEKGHIYDTIQPGYTLDDVIIRPARVVVSK